MSVTSKTVHLEIEILDHSDIDYQKNYLKEHSRVFYEDFLLNHVVFIETTNSFYNTLLKNTDLKVHLNNHAYH